MHARSALPVFGRLREAVEEGAPMSAGYAAGFLCHLALDSACHGWIDRRAAEGTVTHLAMEAEFDRLLMERDGLVSLGHSYLPPMPSGEVFAAAARAAAQGAENSKNFVSKFGRAKSYGTQTIGTPDAGATSMSCFFQGLAQG